jgi:hypothetical protein
MDGWEADRDLTRVLSRRGCCCVRSRTAERPSISTKPSGTTGNPLSLAGRIAQKGFLRRISSIIPDIMICYEHSSCALLMCERRQTGRIRRRGCSASLIGLIELFVEDYSIDVFFITGAVWLFETTGFGDWSGESMSKGNRR